MLLNFVIIFSVFQAEVKCLEILSVPLYHNILHQQVSLAGLHDYILCSLGCPQSRGLVCSLREGREEEGGRGKEERREKERGKEVEGGRRREKEEHHSAHHCNA